MPDVKRRYEVLYRNKPAWVVGEQDADAAKRRVLLTDVTQSKELYPGSFRGKVISIRPEGHPWTEKDLACPTRSLATLELTGEEASALRSKKLKLDRTGRTLLAVSFEDQYGATAANLKRAFPDATVTTEDDERAEINTVIEANHAEQLGYEDAMEGWKRAGAEAIIAMVLFDEPKPIAPVPSPVHEPVFAMEAVRLKRKLSKTIVHSGAGLYEVGPTKTYSTIQSALDQLWTDQGSAAFTAAQYIRIFADTYDENVTPNAGLNPDEANGYYLVIEGDPADTRANVIIAPAAGTYGVFVNCDQCILRHVTVGGTPNNTMVYAATGCVYMSIDDCAISGARTPIDVRYSLQVRDCTLTVTGNLWGLYLAYNRGSVLVERCTLTGPGKATSTLSGIWIRIAEGVEVVGCVVSGFQEAVYVSQVQARSRLAHGANNTFYDCNYGIRSPESAEGAFNWQLLNNIFEDVDYPIRVNIWPEETTTQMGANFLLRNNCYNGYTAFAYGPAAATKTYAQFIALNQVDASGDLDATDPLLTDPGAGDFTLQAASPCIRRAPPAGVIRDVNGDLYATDRTDIGSVSSGTSSAAPGISAVSVSGNDYTATVTPGGAPNVRVRLMTRGGIEEDEEQRLGAGNVVLTATSAGDHTLVAWGCDAAGNPIGEPSAPFIVSVPSPVSSGGSMLRRTPHVITLKRPAVVRDTDNNVATRDYDNPTKTVSIRCLFQTRGGEVSVGDEGQIVPFDSMVYTIEKDVEVNDRIEVALSFYTGNFLVVAVEPKGRVGGVYSHNQVSLQKDGVR